MSHDHFKSTSSGKSFFYEYQIKGVFILFLIFIPIFANFENNGTSGYFRQTFTALAGGAVCIFVAWSLNSFKRPSDRAYSIALIIALITYVSSEFPKLSKLRLSNEDILADKIKKFSTDYRKGLPKINQDGSEIFDLEEGRLFLRFKVRLTNTKKKDVDVKYFDEVMSDSYKQTCEGSDVKTMISSGGDLLYAYYDNENELISEHSLSRFCVK